MVSSYCHDTRSAESDILSLHDALPIFDAVRSVPNCSGYCYTQLVDIEQEQNGIYTYDREPKFDLRLIRSCVLGAPRSEEHTSELQSRLHLVCRLLLEKKHEQHLADDDV